MTPAQADAILAALPEDVLQGFVEALAELVLAVEEAEEEEGGAERE